MRSRLYVFVLCLCAVLILAGTAIAADTQDAVVNKLVEKGVLTKEDAASLIGAQQEESKDLEGIIKALKGFKFGLLWYLSYQNGEKGDNDNGTGYSQFTIKRGYLTVKKDFLPWFTSRMTLDVTTVKDDPADDYTGSLAVRIKYMYGQFNLPDFAFLTKPFIEFGQVHMPWLDYEENLNWYRCQDTMFVERNNTFNSADVGINFVSLLGGLINEEYQKNVNSAYPGRYGSMALSVMNGAGYHAAENNGNKVLEGRLTVRPLPDIVPGLQLSYFGITGKGNKATEPPEWQVNLGFVSFEHEYVVLTGQYYWGKGNQSGADEFKKDGYSVFAELKPNKKFSVIGRYDYFDPNRHQKDDENSRYIAGVAYHLDKQHQNMILLDYDTVNYKQPDKSNDKRVQLTLQVAL
ncbi:MAG TPA: hypothetical protein VEF37_05080 [Thermodesulfovibrionales bacterium]|nr:hypothetical protein [Thermodesulfovibrionales bacterium]